MIYRIIGAIFALCAGIATAHAQSPCFASNQAPNLVGGGNVYGATSSQWKQFFAVKVDSANGQVCNLTVSGTLSAGGLTLQNLTVGTAAVTTLTATTQITGPDAGAWTTAGLTTSNLTTGAINATSVLINGVPPVTATSTQTLTNKTYQSPIFTGSVTATANGLTFQALAPGGNTYVGGAPGEWAGGGNISGTENTYGGDKAGGTATGSFNTAWGHNAFGTGGPSAPSGNSNTCVGTDCMRNASGAVFGNTGVGAGAIQNGTVAFSGSFISAFGQAACGGVTTATHAVCIGYNVQTTVALTVANAYDILIGNDQGVHTVSSTTASAIGIGNAVTPGTDDIILGAGAGANTTTDGNRNVLLGFQTCNLCTSASEVVAIGDSVFEHLLTNGSNVGIGGGSGLFATGSNLTLIGVNSGKNLGSSSTNAIYGTGAVGGATAGSLTGGGHAIFGPNAGGGLTGAAASNTMMGNNVGPACTTATNVIIFGTSNQDNCFTGTETHAIVISTTGQKIIGANSVNLEGVLGITRTNTPSTSASTFAGTLGVTNGIVNTTVFTNNSNFVSGDRAMATTSSSFVSVLGSTGTPNTAAGIAPVMAEVIGANATPGALITAVYGIGIKPAGQVGTDYHIVGGYFAGQDTSGWNNTGIGNFVEGVRSEALLTTGANNGSPYGHVSVAATQSGVAFHFMVGVESEIDNNSGTNAPVNFNLNNFAASFLASNGGANVDDCAFCTNPFNPVAYQRAFFVPHGSLITTSQFEGQASSTWGLMLYNATLTHAIGLPNNGDIRWSNAAANADFNALYVGSDNALHIGQDTTLSGITIGASGVLTVVAANLTVNGSSIVLPGIPSHAGGSTPLCIDGSNIVYKGIGSSC